MHGAPGPRGLLAPGRPICPKGHPRPERIRLHAHHRRRHPASRSRQLRPHFIPQIPGRGVALPQRFRRERPVGFHRLGQPPSALDRGLQEREHGGLLAAPGGHGRQRLFGRDRHGGYRGYLYRDGGQLHASAPPQDLFRQPSGLIFHQPVPLRQLLLIAHNLGAMGRHPLPFRRACFLAHRQRSPDRECGDVEADP